MNLKRKIAALLAFVFAFSAVGAFTVFGAPAGTLGANNLGGAMTVGTAAGAGRTIVVDLDFDNATFGVEAITITAGAALNDLTFTMPATDTTATGTASVTVTMAGTPNAARAAGDHNVTFTANAVDIVVAIPVPVINAAATPAVTGPTAALVATQGTAIANQTFTAANFTNPANIVWSTTPALPAGLTLSGDGTATATIAGTPTATFATAPITVTATAAVDTEVATSAAFNLTVNTAGPASTIENVQNLPPSAPGTLGVGFPVDRGDWGTSLEIVENVTQTGRQLVHLFIPHGSIGGTGTTFNPFTIVIHQDTDATWSTGRAGGADGYSEVIGGSYDVNAHTSIQSLAYRLTIETNRRITLSSLIPANSATHANVRGIVVPLWLNIGSLDEPVILLVNNTTVNVTAVAGNNGIIAPERMGGVPTAGAFSNTAARTYVITENRPGAFTRGMFPDSVPGATVVTGNGASATRGLTLTIGNLNGPFQFEDLPTVFIAGHEIPVAASHAGVSAHLAGITGTANSNGIITTLPNIGNPAAPGSQGNGTQNSYAFLSHDRTRLNIVISHFAGGVRISDYGLTQGQIARTITVSDVVFGQRNAAEPTWQTDVPLVIGSAIGTGGNTFATHIAGGTTASIAAATFAEQAITLQRHRGVAANPAADAEVQELVAGRMWAEGVVFPGTGPALTSGGDRETTTNDTNATGDVRANFVSSFHQLFERTTPSVNWSHLGGRVANLRLSENVAMQAAGSPGLSALPYTFTLTDADGNALESATISGVALHTGTPAEMARGFNHAHFANNRMIASRLSSSGDMPGGTDEATVQFSQANAFIVMGLQRHNDHRNTGIALDAQIRINTDPAFEGPVYVTVTGSNFSSTVHVADVTPVVTVETVTRFVQVGSARVEVADIIITETAAGMLRANENLVIGLQQVGVAGMDEDITGPGGVLEGILGAAILWHPIAAANIEVTGHATASNRVGIDTNNMTPRGATGVNATPRGNLTLPITRESIDEPSTITLSGLTILTGERVASGARNVNVGGRAVSDIQWRWIGTSFNNAVDTNARFGTADNIVTPFITIGTEAQGSVHNVVSIQQGTSVAMVNGTPRLLANAAGVPTPTINAQDRLFVPIRGVSYLFGAEVTPADNRAAGGNFQVWIVTADVTAIFTLGSTTVNINGVDRNLPGFDVAPFIPTEGVGANSFYLPFRAIGEAFDIVVGWDQATNTAWYNPTNQAFVLNGATAVTTVEEDLNGDDNGYENGNGDEEDDEDARQLNI